MALPAISETPHHHSDCCLSISTVLLDAITNSIQDQSKPSLVLSIGSGRGLLEALLQSRWAENSNCDLKIEGVEVHSSTSPVNRYLPEEKVTIVNGTWDYCARADQADVLMFVYPRDPKLVSKYLETFNEESGCAKMAIWLGPRIDWEDFRSCFTDIERFCFVDVVENCGLVPYEMMAVACRQKR